MRKILFKAKRIDNDQWIEGYLFKIWDIAHIMWGTTNGKPDYIEVDPETVCQLSPITDDKNTPIWESDIVQFGAQMGSIGEVKFLDNNAAFVARDRFGDYQFLYNIEASTTITVIGNRFDNPELLKS